MRNYRVVFKELQLISLTYFIIYIINFIFVKLMHYLIDIMFIFIILQYYIIYITFIYYIIDIILIFITFMYYIIDIDIDLFRIWSR